MLHVMTVCTGNICRSPMAEIVLRERFEEAGLGGAVVVDSTGVSSEEHGNPIDRRARAVLAERGYSVGSHRARRIQRSEMVQQDLLLPMTYSHYRELLRLAGIGGGWRENPRPDDVAAAEAVGIRMYRSFDPEFVGAEPGYRLDLEDPWYGGHEDFETALDQIESGVAGIIEFAREVLAAPACG